jgi:hypothetical protein
VVHLAHQLRGDDHATIGEQIVRLVHAAGGGVLDGQQHQVLLAAAQGLHRLAGQVEAGEQHAARPVRIALACGQVAVGALDARVAHAQRGGVQPRDERLLPRHGHVDEEAPDALHLVRVQPVLRRAGADAAQEQVLSALIPKGRRRGQLRARHVVRQVHAAPERIEDFLVDALDGDAHRLQVWNRAHRKDSRVRCMQWWGPMPGSSKVSPFREKPSER